MDIVRLYSYFINSSGITIDTRNIEANSIFFCLTGENFNGNQFAKQALEKGVSLVILDDANFYIENDERYILVQDSLEILQNLALHHRNQFDIPVIAITGSNGKTTTKELLYSVLSTQYKTTSTTGNLNNHIGVPLTLLKIASSTEIAIIEMGASKLGDIELLCKIANPTHGYISNFGKAHLDGFKNIEGVIKGKSELYRFIEKNEGTVLIDSSNDKQVELTKNNNRYTFGFYGTENFLFSSNISSSKTIEITDENNVTYKSSLKGDYNIINIIAAISFGKIFRISNELIQQGIANYSSNNNRSQWIKKGNNTLCLDAYNANPSSMEVAIKSFFTSTPMPRVIILGDMLELGTESLIEHQRIVNHLYCLETSLVILIGDNFSKTKSAKKNLLFKTTDEAIQYIQSHPFNNTNILLKGSRKIALERLINYL